LGKVWPCEVVAVYEPDGSYSVPVVDVKFLIETPLTIPHVKMPVAGSEYIRLPIRVGDKGIAVAADTGIGNVSGIGTVSTVGFTQPLNLSALVFQPIGNAHWAAFDPNSLILYSSATGATISVSPTLITLTSGACTITLNSSGVMNIQDSAHHTSPTVMHDNFAAFVIWANNHSHYALGASPAVPYTGANIAP
jgi:hypothetical protein